MRSFIQKLKEKQAADQQAARDDWKQLVADVADGAKVNPDKAATVLSANQRTTDELQTAAELFLQRREWAATLQTEPVAVEARRVARERRRQAEADFAKQNEERTKRIEALAREEVRANGMFIAVKEARKKLLDSVSPELRAREAELQQQRIAAVGDQLEAIEAELNKLQASKLEP